MSPSVEIASYSEEELAAMMADLESDIVERKESLRGDAPVKIREAVCAFANDLPDRRRPGVVLVGVDDDGRAVGGDVSDELLRQLADIKTDGNIVPPPTMVVEPRVLAGVRVAVATVRPSDSPPVRYQGRIWIRVGPRRAVAGAQDERILSEKRRHRDPHFDARRAPGGRLADLSLRRFEEEYLPSAVDAETLASNDRSTEERLAAAKMIVSVDDPVPTMGGVLVLGKRPQDFVPGAYAQFLRVAGTEFGDPVTTEVCQGVIEDVVRRLGQAHRRTIERVDFPSWARFAIRPIPWMPWCATPSPDSTKAPTRPPSCTGSTTASRSASAQRRKLRPAGRGRLRSARRGDAGARPGATGFGIPGHAGFCAPPSHPEPEFRLDPTWKHCTVPDAGPHIPVTGAPPGPGGACGRSSSHGRPGARSKTIRWPASAPDRSM